MQFEWDREKAKKNIKKHKVSFEEAMVSFTERKETIRIISARYTTVYERKKHEN